LLAEAEEAEQLIAKGQEWIEQVDQFNRNDRHIGLSLPLNQAWPHLMAAKSKLTSFSGTGSCALYPKRPSSGRPRLPQPRNFEGLLIERLDAICPSSAWEHGSSAKRQNIRGLAQRIASKLGLETVTRGLL
jgi:hypothetical protein